MALYLTKMVGNVLAGHLATKMGLPVDKLVGTTIPGSLQWNLVAFKAYLLPLETNEYV